MLRPGPSIDELITNAVSQALSRIAPIVQRRIAALAARELDKALAFERGGKRAPGLGRRRASGAELTRWVADRNARRVPTFVIEQTGGLDTKRKIVARYGEDAVFDKGKPPPKPAK